MVQEHTGEMTMLINCANKGCSEAFSLLFDKYKPIVLSVNRKYYLKDYDIDDWLQEGRIIFFKSLKTYDMTMSITLGIYFKGNFLNHVYSLIRRQETQKRQIDRQLIPFDFQESYLDSIQTYFCSSLSGASSYEYVHLRCDLESFKDKPSVREQLIFIEYIVGASEEPYNWIEKNERQKINALQRWKRKLKQHLNY